MNETLKRYLISSGVTFLTGFLGAVLMSLQTLSVSELLQAGVLVGIFTAALRIGLKAVVEGLITLYQRK